MAYNIKNWPRSDGAKKIIAIDGYNSDIIESINTAFFRAVAETRGMAQEFKGSSRLASTFNIWKFIKNNIVYKKDPDSLQMIKLPGRLLQDRTGDCKSISIICAALLKNLGYPVVFRYVSYNSNPTPTHIYVLTYDKDGSPIICDAVYSKFNAEPSFKSKRDYLMKIKNS